MLRSARRWLLRRRERCWVSSGASVGARRERWSEAGGGAFAKFLVPVLKLIKTPVDAAMGEELLVAAHFAKLAAMHDEDSVGALNRREAVGDDDGGAAGDHALESGAHTEFGIGIDGGSGFIGDEDARVVGEGAGEVDELLLAGGEGIAALAERLVVSAGKRFDEVMDVDLLGGLLDAGVVNFCAEANVVGDGAAEEEW